MADSDKVAVVTGAARGIGLEPMRGFDSRPRPSCAEQEPTPGCPSQAIGS
jgi:hypothetical protein